MFVLVKKWLRTTCLILLCIQRSSQLSQSIYYGEVEIDKIVYASVRIPRNAIQMRFVLSVQTKDSNLDPPFVLLKYNGLPTIGNYDEKYQLPTYPDVLSITDDRPSESVLYFGIWGGAMLHSYRYFAGSPLTCLVGIVSYMKTCNSEYQRGDDCQGLLSTLSPVVMDANQLLSYGSTGINTNTNTNTPTSIHSVLSSPSPSSPQQPWSSATVSFGTYQELAIHVTHGIEALSVQISLLQNDIHQLCQQFKLFVLSQSSPSPFLHNDLADRRKNTSTVSMMKDDKSSVSSLPRTLLITSQLFLGQWDEKVSMTACHCY